MGHCGQAQQLRHDAGGLRAAAAIAAAAATFVAPASAMGTVVSAHAVVAQQRGPQELCWTVGNLHRNGDAAAAAESAGPKIPQAHC